MSEPDKKQNKGTVANGQAKPVGIKTGDANPLAAATKQVKGDVEQKKPPPAKKSSSAARLDEESYKKRTDHYPWEHIGSFNEGRKFDRSFIADAHLIKAYVVETFQSDLHWNTAVVVGTCFFSWVIAKFRFGIFGLVIVLLTTASIYKAEFRRFKRNIRDDLMRVTAAERLTKSPESMEWMNSFLAKFWVIYMPALSETVKTIANETLKDVAPGYGIDALTLDEFTLGTKAPRIDSIKSYTQKGDDLVEMDWAFSFTPDDTSDMTKREIERKINPKVALGVRVGKGFISKSLPILLEDMSIAGRVKITMNLSLNFPHISIVSIQLLEPPKIDFALKPVGGDTFGLDIMSLIPGLSSLITNLINSNAGPMLYAPNHLDIDLLELMEQQSNDAIGVVALTVKGITDLKKAINPYVQVAVENEPEKHIRTDVKAQTKAPHWNETKYILINSVDQKMTFELFDFNLSKKKGELYASHEFDLGDLVQKDTHIDVNKPLLISGKKQGNINYDIRWFPTAIKDNSSNADEETNEVELPDSEVGIFKLKLHQAKGLDNTLSLTGRLSPKAELYINGRLSKTFRTMKRANEPSWEESFEVLITQKASTIIKLVLTDTGSDSEIGVVEETLDNLVFNVEHGEDYFPLSTQGEVRLFAGFKPVLLSGVSSSVNHAPPVGIVRVHLRKGHDLLNLETVGEVDPYVKVLLTNRLKYKTAYHPETVNPEFNDVVYIPVSNTSQHLTLEVMDFQKRTKNRKLGSTNLSISNVVKKDSNGLLLFHDGANEILSAPLALKNKKPKGKISYSLSFLPTIPVYSLKELEDLKQRKEQILAKKEAQAKELKEWEDLYKKTPNDYEWVEAEDFNTEDDGSDKEKLSLDELLTYRSGALVVHFLSGKVKKPETHIQVLLDDYAPPSFVTGRTNAREVSPEVGDVFIRDLPNSRIIFRNTKKPFIKDSDAILDEASFNTIDLLKKGYSDPMEISIGSSKVQVRFEYIPSAIKLPPSETILDTGRAQLEFVDAENLVSSDRNGKSDPFVTVSLGGAELFKSKVIKKTLNPTWKETTTIPVPSRVRSELEVSVYDWDRAGKNELIGRTKLDISKVTPLEYEVVTLNLEPQGQIRIGVLFSPEYIRPKVGESEFGLGLSGLAGVPLKGVGAAAGLATGVIGGGVGVAGSALGAGAGVANSALGTGTGAIGNALSTGTSVVGKGGSLFKNVLTGKKSRASLDQPGHPGDLSRDNQSMKSGRSKVHSNGDAATHSSSGGTGSGSVLAIPSPRHSKSHSRSPSELSTFTTHVKGKKSTVGTVILRNGTNLGHHAQLRVSLAINGKLKNIGNTKNAKASNGVIRWDEEVDFDAPPDAEVVFGGVVHRMMAKDQELGNAKIKLAEVIDNPRDVTLNLGQGNIVVNFRYSPEPTSSGGTPPPPGW